jgi:hypothetical protein
VTPTQTSTPPWQYQALANEVQDSRQRQRNITTKVFVTKLRILKIKEPEDYRPVIGSLVRRNYKIIHTSIDSERTITITSLKEYRKK